MSIQRPIWLTTNVWLPCDCCVADFAYTDGIWSCKRGPKWFVMDREPDLSKPHDIRMCNARCGNPFHIESSVLFAWGEMNGLGWGDVDYILEKEEESRLAPEELQRLEAEKEAKRVKEEEEAEKKHLSSKLACKVREHEIKAHYKCNQGKKEMRPCKYLYSCEGDRKTGGARPTTKHISSECWSHAYTDPVTGQRIEKNVCWFLHPGEEGWRKEWVRDRNFVPPSTPSAPAKLQKPNRFAALSGKPQAQQQTKTQEKPKQKIKSAFSILCDSDSD